MSISSKNVSIQGPEACHIDFHAAHPNKFIKESQYMHISIERHEDAPLFCSLSYIVLHCNGVLYCYYYCTAAALSSQHNPPHIK